MTEQKQGLPKGLQSFEKIIEKNALYVDKTQEIFSLVQNEAMTCFLARPRRFGKSLLLSTLKALFQGKRALLKGTWMETADHEWGGSDLHFNVQDRSASKGCH